MKFQSTHPLRGATQHTFTLVFFPHISIHAPLAGCDPTYVHACFLPAYFNPRTPCGVRPFFAVGVSGANIISIHAPLAGCDHLRLAASARRNISIHAPLAGCDTAASAQSGIIRISIHAPLAGCDLMCRMRLLSILLFQSTHPLRGATWAYIYHDKDGVISIHAPLAGCDIDPFSFSYMESDFNPRTPCGVRL